MKSINNHQPNMMVVRILALFLAIQSTQGQNAALPSVGIGLDGVNYFMEYYPFTDAMKCARWINVAAWDSLGNPTAANPGTLVRARTAIDNQGRLPNGDYVLTWEGDGEVIFYNSIATLAEEDLSGTTKRRVYDVQTTSQGIGVQIQSFPVSNIKLWIPEQENASGLWSPQYLCYMDGFSGGVIRTMDLGQTNSSPQSTWSHRTPPAWSTYQHEHNFSTAYAVNGGVPYEAMVELANMLDADLWVCVPHMADSTYVRYLGHLLRTGVDLATGQQTGSPLASHLQVWLEYSNEVWNFAPAFQQTNWVLNNCPGANLDEKYAHKARDIFEQFEAGFQDRDRTIRVLGTQTAGAARTDRRINALDSMDWDVLAITTYFEYDYGQYIYDHWAGGLSHDTFYAHITMQMDTGAFDISESDAIHRGSAYAYLLAGIAGKDVVTYEGNEHFNMNRRVDTDGNGSNDTPLAIAAPGSLEWMHDFCRSDYMYDLLERYQNRHEASGLTTHVPYVAVREWSFTGQWGYAEYLGQPMTEATKYRWLHDHFGRTYPVHCDSMIASSNTIDVQLTDSCITQFYSSTADSLEVFGRLTSYEIELLDSSEQVITPINTDDTRLILDLLHAPSDATHLRIQHRMRPMLYYLFRLP